MTFTVSQPQWSLDSQGPALGLCLLNHLGLIRISGEQGRSFIHGQVTADISSLANDAWCWGAHCDPKGRMLASFRAFSLGDALALMMPRSALEIDLPQLKKYAVFSKAELVDASGDWTLLGVMGSEAKAFVEAKFGPCDAALTALEQGAVIRDKARYILVLPKADAEALMAGSGQPLYDASAWQALEIRDGYPNLAANHANEYIPQMCNLQALDGISFTKGCYMGQETVARTHYRGGNKRALYVLSGTAATKVRLESTLEIAVEGGHRKAGNIIEVVQRDNQVLLTAVLANDTPADALLRLADDLGAELRPLPLPYSLEQA
ncbi:tRNA-modifying protein YgfZ [Shewanella sedimentimangrovi]|uniref:tRNA-modifying protein YgfZ n=1 Tax=Shewanella sedimentimangrovi TaxID=2814293 RepID=A0ABX7R309_9GAMM|nr:tRNA-modifying protein YgfZ [Shewanella sedimentimangrovi]QSX37879.1 tRNA-modifying protein YgfZ [Shewanella sedimentimangrovi]